MGAARVQAEAVIRVRYAECDAMGYLHHAKYFEYLEVARTDLLRMRGITYRECEEHGIFFVVVKLACRYILPIRYDDFVTVRAWIDRIGGARIDHAYELTVEGRLTTRAETTLACVGRDGKPRLMPKNLWPEAEE